MDAGVRKSGHRTQRYSQAKGPGSRAWRYTREVRVLAIRWLLPQATATNPPAIRELDDTGTKGPGDHPRHRKWAPREPADRPPAGAGNVPRAAGAGNVPAPDDREPPQDAIVPPTGRPDEVGAAPGPVGAEDGPQVASVGTSFQHTISPIDFYMGPVLDLSDQTYAAINFPVTLATGRDVRIQIVILSAPPGAAGGTRERGPSDPRPDRPGTRTSWRGGCPPQAAGQISACSHLRSSTTCSSRRTSC